MRGDSSPECLIMASLWRPMECLGISAHASWSLLGLGLALMARPRRSSPVKIPTIAWGRAPSLSISPLPAGGAVGLCRHTPAICDHTHPICSGHMQCFWEEAVAGMAGRLG
jgi:hypothetical protein